MIEAAQRAGRRPLFLLLLGLRLQRRPPDRTPSAGPSRSPTPTRPTPSAATAGRSSSRRSSARSTGPSAASRRPSPASTTSTAPSAPGTAAARRPRRPCRARSSRPRTTAAAPSRSGATGRGRGASCGSSDCLNGIDMIMHCDELVATPINLGSHELVSVNELLGIIEDIAGFKVERRYDLDAAAGRRRPQLRQHHDPAGPRLGAVDAAPRGHGQDLRLDRGAVRPAEGGKKGRPLRVGPPVGALRSFWPVWVIIPAEGP